MSSEQPLPQATASDLFTTAPDLQQSTIEERNRILQTALSKSRTLHRKVTAFKATSPSKISTELRETFVVELAPILFLKDLIPDGHPTLETLLSELHHIHNEAKIPPPPSQSPIKIPSLKILSCRLRHGHGIMGFRYAYHCLLARPGAQAEKLLRRQQVRAEDVEGIDEARVLYELDILQSRLEMLIAALEKAGVVVLEEGEEKERKVDERESDEPSVYVALTGDPALTLE